MFSFPDTPIFSSREREDIETSEYARPYVGITKNQLVGLLLALGEYGTRNPFVRSWFIEMLPKDPELAERNDALIGCWRQLRKGNLSGIASRDEFVFDAQERGTLSLNKYIRSCEHVNKREVVGILDALGRYSLTAPILHQVFDPLMGYARAIHAHNRLVAFRDQPFTFDEYVRSLRAMKRGMNSQITP